MDIRMLAAAMAATAALAAAPAFAAPRQAPTQDLAAQYAGWAGSPENAQSLVSGLRSGGTIMIVTRAPGGRMSLAGFSPRHSLSDGEISQVLATARRDLSRLGIQRPTAEQIQAAIVGGEVESQGRTVELRGQVPTGPVASR